MTATSAKADLHRYLQKAREALLWKLDGLSDYNIRRPMTRTGTNLLGLVKHTARMELGYLGDTFGRSSGEPLPWFDDDAEPNADMWAAASESREDIIALYHRAWEHSDATIDALDLNSTGHVAHWPDDRSTVTLHQILVHLLGETTRHAGHADIVRELIDDAAGLQETSNNLPDRDDAWWAEYRSTLERTAAGEGRSVRGRTAKGGATSLLLL